MIHRFLVLLVCLAGLSLAQDLQTQAKSAVAEKRFNDALALYRTLLAGNSTDLDTILWIAKLSAWTEDYPASLEFYSKALALDAGNVDAMLGKANVLMWMHSYREAFVVLTEAHRIAPANTDVELAWSHYYHFQGDDAKAKLFLAKSLAFDHANQDALRLQDSLFPKRIIELRIAYEGDTLAGTTPGSIEQIGATCFYAKGDVGVGFSHLDRFGEAGNRGGLHFSRNLDSATTVRAAAIFGEGGAIVARVDLSAGVSRKMRPGLVLGADYRYIAFQTIKVNAEIGNIEYYFERPIWLQASIAAIEAEGSLTPSVLIRFNDRVRKNLTLNVGYGHGTEVFQRALPTEFGDLKRDSYIGGAIFAITEKTRTETTYSLARRSTGGFENMFLIALVHKL
jgi:YaiO family outer membrane protein